MCLLKEWDWNENSGRTVQEPEVAAGLRVWKGLQYARDTRFACIISFNFHNSAQNSLSLFSK